ncbi:hypothetical protein [Pararhizobium gei]|uniref:hypothetical protein n=1 Tax=Pararhizobium gei TaxID=1395951 RepID=UPI0023DA745B|nr:hypothetical protein [Rhizobium gei]
MPNMENRDALESAVNDAHRLVTAAAYILSGIVTGDARNPVDMAETILAKAINELREAVSAVS